MLNTIVNLRGTSGSGKSTVVYNIFSKFGREVVETETTPKTRKEKPLVYRVDIGTGVPLYVLGRYESQCGGCDTMTDYSQRVPKLLDRYGDLGHVLFEGALMSTHLGAIADKMTYLQATAKARSIFALLDTPLDLCLDRIRQRRAARGETKPLDPKNTESKFRAALSAQRKLATRQYCSAAVVPHERATSTVLAWYGVKYREPKKVATAETWA